MKMVGDPPNDPHPDKVGVERTGGRFFLLHDNTT